MGAKVADVGCGLGASTILMAKKYESKFFGFDYHAGSIEMAREGAEREGVANRVTFAVAPAKSYPGKDYDLVAFFDCLHDMGDPVGAAAHVRSTLKQDGTWMLVEPFAEDTPEANHNPIGRVFYSASTLLCVPASMSQEVGAALGAQPERSASARWFRRVVSEVQACNTDAFQPRVRSQALSMHTSRHMPARLLIRSRVSLICLGSRPAVGSSSIKTSGLWMMAWARPTRWR